MSMFDPRSIRAATAVALGLQSPACDEPATTSTDAATITYHAVEVDGVDVFYREAGPAEAPVVVLLHGFPASSHMFRDLMPRLGDQFRLIAPDYPGFGHSGMPAVDEFEYTFEHLSQIIDHLLEALSLDRYSLYLMDIGAPIGFRIAALHPERVQSLIVQNGNTYEEGLGEFWDLPRAYWEDPSPEIEEQLRGFLTLDGTKFQYMSGVRDQTKLSPDAWTLDQSLLDRAGNQEIQLALLYDYRTNPPLCSSWQAYLRQHQPSTLVVWGKNDPLFTVQGAELYRRDLEDVELHLLDTGHFALEDHVVEIAARMRDFLERTLPAR